MTTMMKCGHTANATTEAGKPVCVICYGIVPGADEPGPAPDLTGRTMVCIYHPVESERPSDPSAPFFEYRPQSDHDLYYCGCWGWD